MSDERSMREELDALARRLAEREAELDRLEAVVSGLERGPGGELTTIPAGAGAAETSPLLIQPAAPLVVRDPAVVELLKQSAGTVVRFEHLRVSVENLDRKIDALARETLHRRDEDEARRVRKETEIAARRDRMLRLALMTVFLLALALLWAIL